ncbi:hypothetical protein KEM55_005729 [Ascosphaera atra]|nr:hypothetical protein KEM55_005729 [Ascosphaera atra]
MKLLQRMRFASPKAGIASRMRSDAFSSTRRFKHSKTTLSSPSSSPGPSSPNQVHSPPHREKAFGRLEKFHARLPKWMQPFTKPLLGAPLTHVTSFFILHELTAILPLFGLAAAFHYSGWVPFAGSAEGNKADADAEGPKFTAAVEEGVHKFGKWLRKKGWVEDEDEQTTLEGGARVTSKGRGPRLILEFATAYAITKLLLPVRIIASVWATPWFARSLLVPASNIFKRVVSKARGSR